jgi:hypothetical protein
VDTEESQIDQSLLKSKAKIDKQKKVKRKNFYGDDEEKNKYHTKEKKFLKMETFVDFDFLFLSRGDESQKNNY